MPKTMRAAGEWTLHSSPVANTERFTWRHQTLSDPACAASKAVRGSNSSNKYCVHYLVTWTSSRYRQDAIARHKKFEGIGDALEKSLIKGIIRPWSDLSHMLGTVVPPSPGRRAKGAITAQKKNHIADKSCRRHNWRRILRRMARWRPERGWRSSCRHAE